MFFISIALLLCMNTLSLFSETEERGVFLSETNEYANCITENSMEMVIDNNDIDDQDVQELLSDSDSIDNYEGFLLEPLHYHASKLVVLNDAIQSVSPNRLKEYITLVIHECMSFSDYKIVESVWHSTQFADSGTLVIYLFFDMQSHAIKPFVTWIAASEEESLIPELQEVISSFDSRALVD